MTVSVHATADGTGPRDEATRLRRVHGVAVGAYWPGAAQPLYSQGNEEVLIRDFFKDGRDGVFLDVGCSRPTENSTTYYLERHLGWTGIAVDALPEHAAHYEEKRPGTRFARYIVTDHGGTIEKFYRVPVTGLSSTERNRQFRGRILPAEELEAPTATLNQLLEAMGISHIDFLSMDIEGGEVKALAGFDIDKYRPQLVCIESCRVRRWIEAYFANHGYHHVVQYRRYDYINCYFTPVEMPPRNVGPEAPASALAAKIGSQIEIPRRDRLLVRAATSGWKRAR